MHIKEVVQNQGGSSHSRCVSTLPWLGAKVQFSTRVEDDDAKWFITIGNLKSRLVEVFIYKQTHQAANVYYILSTTSIALLRAPQTMDASNYIWQPYLVKVQ